MVAAQSGDFRHAVELWTRARDMYGKLADADRESVIFINLGGMHDVFGDLKLAQTYYSRALEHFKKTGDELAEARILNNIGKLHHDMADWAKAMEFYGQALPIFRKLKNKRLEAITLANLGSPITRSELRTRRSSTSTRRYKYGETSEIKREKRRRRKSGRCLRAVGTGRQGYRKLRKITSGPACYRGSADAGNHA